MLAPKAVIGHVELLQIAPLFGESAGPCPVGWSEFQTRQWRFEDVLHINSPRVADALMLRQGYCQRGVSNPLRLMNDLHRHPGMGQHLRCCAGVQQTRQSAAPASPHQYQVAAQVARCIDDFASHRVRHNSLGGQSGIALTGRRDMQCQRGLRVGHGFGLRATQTFSAGHAGAIEIMHRAQRCEWRVPWPGRRLWSRPRQR